MTGKYSFMMAGLPAASYAMYTCAKPENKKVVGGLLVSAALTSLLTGITEPIKFTFLFIAPALFIVHCVFAGLSFVLMHILDICIGTTFSCGLIDFVCIKKFNLHCSDIMLIVLDSPQLPEITYLTGINAVVGETVVAQW